MSANDAHRDDPVAAPEPDVLSIRDGELHVEDVRATELVERFGSPIFVFSETQLRGNLRRIRSAFARGWPDGPVDVLPAFKANTMLATRHILSEEDAGADVYSPEELDGVLRTGVDPTLVSVNGGGKPREHLRRCVQAGVRITVEDVHEIDLIQEVAAELATVAKVRFRVKSIAPNLWRRTDFSQATVPIDLGIQVYKSGIPQEYLVEMGRRVFAMPNVELVGLHVHQGRHHPSPWYWEGLMTRFARVVGELSRAWGGWQPKEIDIGGGFPSKRDPMNKEMPRSEFVLTALSYPLMIGLRGLGESAYHGVMGKVLPLLTNEHKPVYPPPIEEFARAATTALRTGLRREGVRTDGVRLQVEPGRWLHGDTAVHLARVKVLKKQTKPYPYAWVLTDTTYFFLAGGKFEHNRYPYLVANRPNAPRTLKADIVGHSCFEDILILGGRVPEVEPGDVIAFLDAGAYQEASASNFNALPRPASVLVHGGEAELVKRAETLEDVWARDVVPDRVRTEPRTASPTAP
jgi:diaminopimelate decarboxylase